MLISGCGGEQLQGFNNVVEHLMDDRSTKSDVDNVEISDGGQSNVEKEQSKAHSGYNRQKNKRFRQSSIESVKQVEFIQRKNKNIGTVKHIPKTDIRHCTEDLGGNKEFTSEEKYNTWTVSREKQLRESGLYAGFFGRGGSIACNTFSR